MKDTADVIENYSKALAIQDFSRENQRLLYEFNNTAVPYPAEKTIVDLFEEQVAMTPDYAALFHDNKILTYAELNNRANRLARYLVSRGVRAGDNIGIMALRNFDLVTGLFAILKCGAAYVPVEPDYPVERQKYMLARSSVEVVLTNLNEPLQELAEEYRIVRLQQVAFDEYSGENLRMNIDSRQLAYTIYTSGSTGLPKGVMIEHHSVVNLINWVNGRFNVTSEDRLFFITSVCFDLSVYDIFGILAAGGGIVIADKKDVMDVTRLTDMLQHYKITFWNSVPTTIDYIANRLAATGTEFLQNHLRLVFLSGDWIPVPLPDKIRYYFPNAQVVGLGGATEGTVWSNYYIVGAVSSHQRSIPYGVPIANSSFYILDEYLQPVPPGETGELYIGGVGVARGYANDLEKTEQAFLPDPFTQQWGGRMYRTGDLGHMLPDRNMEFLGRKDSQVKIRGHRVELGEIEHCIRQSKFVANVVVLYHEDKQKLVAYLVKRDNFDYNALIALMKTQLPEYMMPNVWIDIDDLPLTANGKIDKTTLREYGKKQVKENYTAPRTALEKSIASIWQRVLATDNVSIDDNFFASGGQSLLAVELITEMEKALDKSLPVNILYKYGTIAELASHLEKEATGKIWKSLVAIKPSGSKIPLYLVHGDGLSLTDFHNLGRFVDEEQPIYSFQPVGLNGEEEPDTINDIATQYVDEILQHNPGGPYALAGYSFGGYIVVEMKKILEAMNKPVKMLAIFDTDANDVRYKKEWTSTLSMRIKRQIPKLFFIAKSLLMYPASTINYQTSLFSKKITELCYSLGIKEKPHEQGAKNKIDKINETHLKAYRSYQLTSFNDKVHLFRAKLRRYYVDDFQYLGWANYAQQGVSVYEVPGDHKTMFNLPNVRELARLLQHALDNC